MRRWWRRRSLRARLLYIGVAGLSLGFLVGAIGLVAALGYVLQRSVDTEALATADQIAQLVEAGPLPQPLPAAGTGQVQVIDASGRVRGASIDADRLVPMLNLDELARAREGERLFVDGDRIGIHGPLRVVAVPAGPAGDPQTVLVGRSTVDALRGIGVLRTLLLIVFPLLVIVLALVAWRVIGATLRPVEALRQGAERITAEEITGAGGSTRLPVPVGRDEIHRLAVTLNGMLDRLEAGRARQREFVGDAAHELRSPLANMRTQLEVAQHLGPAADWPTVGEDLHTDVGRLSRLVDDLLLLARTDASAPLSRPATVDLAAIVREVGTRPSAVPVTLSVLAEPAWTVGSADDLRRVLANLVDNALRYALTTVAVSSTLSSTVDGTRAVLSVTDDGPGIPEGDRDRVFERFTRLDDARARDAGGSGLGLAIVRELVRRHGGTVHLSDAVPTGLRVEVRLPVASPPSSRPQADPAG
jgi:signal transduction histidine kinase